MTEELTASQRTARLEELQARRTRAIAQERIVRDAASLHRPTAPLFENIAGYKAVPLTLWHYNLLRLVDSPFAPPFGTPTTEEVAAFLWMVSPEFTPGESVVKRLFLKRCERDFYQPRKPFIKTRRAIEKWTQSAANALEREGEIVEAARQYIAEAMQDKPESSGAAGPDYYCDSVALCGALAREYGWSESDIMTMPLKRIFQYLKEIRETRSAMNGGNALLCNPSDAVVDEILNLLNSRN